jgi:hypothetical protein
MAGQKGRSGSGGNRKGAGRPKGAVDAQPRYRIAKSLSVPKWEIAKYTLQYAYEAFDRLVEIMRDVEAPGAARVLAASKILDRAWARRRSMATSPPCVTPRSCTSRPRSSDSS